MAAAESRDCGCGENLRRHTRGYTLTNPLYSSALSYFTKDVTLGIAHFSTSNSASRVSHPRLNGTQTHPLQPSTSHPPRSFHPPHPSPPNSTRPLRYQPPHHLHPHPRTHHPLPLPRALLAHHHHPPPTRSIAKKMALRVLGAQLYGLLGTLCSWITVGMLVYAVFVV